MSEDRVSLRFDSLRSFLDECSGQISEEGIFLPSKAISPVGSKVEFDLGLADDFPLLRGSGEVVWVVEANGEGTVPGMAVRYEATDDATATLVRRIAERQRSSTGSAFELSRGGAEEAPAEKEPSAFATQAVTAAMLDAEEAEEAAADESGEVASEAPAPSLSVPPYLEDTLSKAQGTKPRRGGLWAALGLIAILAGALYWQRDLVTEKLGGGRELAEAPVTEPVTTDVVEPEIQTAVEPEAPAPVEAAELEPEPAAPTGPLSRIDEVRWRAIDGGTLLELVADGAFPEGGEGYAVERLEDPPRLLLRISGVTAPLARPTVAVGSEEVVGIRTALHGSPPSSSLHVVVDLADPTAQLTGSEIDGARLQLRISSSAISP